MDYCTAFQTRVDYLVVDDTASKRSIGKETHTRDDRHTITTLWNFRRILTIYVKKVGRTLIRKNIGVPHPTTPHSSICAISGASIN